MNCAQVQERLSLYYDTELSADDCEDVRAHLEKCAECSHELASFGMLSSMLQRLPMPASAELGWEQVAKELAGKSPLQVARRTTRPQRRSRSTWVNLQGLRPAFAVAALLLVAVGWWAIELWFARTGHNLLAAVIQNYVHQFQQDPQAAQQVLLTNYDGRTVKLDEAVRLVSYEPAARQLPRQYTVDSMYLLKLPCCDCLQTICQRDDGSKFVIFEYGEEHPASAADRPGGIAQCCGENCCLVQINELFTMSWKKGERHISMVGLRDQADVADMGAWLR